MCNIPRAVFQFALKATIFALTETWTFNNKVFYIAERVKRVVVAVSAVRITTQTLRALRIRLLSALEQCERYSKITNNLT